VAAARAQLVLDFRELELRGRQEVDEPSDGRAATRLGTGDNVLGGRAFRAPVFRTALCGGAAEDDHLDVVSGTGRRVLRVRGSAGTQGEQGQGQILDAHGEYS